MAAAADFEAADSESCSSERQEALRVASNEATSRAKVVPEVGERGGERKRRERERDRAETWVVITQWKIP